MRLFIYFNLKQRLSSSIGIHLSNDDIYLLFDENPKEEEMLDNVAVPKILKLAIIYVFI